MRWLRNPMHVGTPVPSSKGLANAMAEQLKPIFPSEYVVELGPGTGVVTRAILQAGVPEQNLVIVELDHSFIKKLKHEFPQAIILHGDARNLKSLLQSRGIKQVASVISSLPLLAMPDSLRHAIVNAAFEAIKPNGSFVQYTYGLLSPLSKTGQRQIGIKGKVAKRIWKNFPPARVWRYKVETAA